MLGGDFCIRSFQDFYHPLSYCGSIIITTRHLFTETEKIPDLSCHPHILNFFPYPGPDGQELSDSCRYGKLTSNQ